MKGVEKVKEKFTNMETAVIHSGYDAKEHLGSLATPIFQTSTFTFESAEQGERRFAGEEDGFIYSRLGNPTVKALEERIAELEGAEAGLAFGSGMAAVSAILMALTKSGDHILCSQGVYGCTFGLLQLMEEKYQITHDFCSMETEEQLETLIRPETACIYVETPINPTMKLIDLELVAKIAKKHGIPVVVDNTFSSPYLQQPLKAGCDIVLHSATKYIGGHGDVIAGLAAGKKELIHTIAMTTLKDVGGVMSPFDAWLLLRGMKTLPVRMDRHCENAEYIVEQLKQHPAVQQVFYPGDATGGDYEIMQKQMKKGGGLISFEINGSKQHAQQLLNRLSLIKIAVSLGDAETLIQHPATMTHSGVPEQKRVQMGISDKLIRLSVGLEAKQDIWEDLQQALDQLMEVKTPIQSKQA
ncbi:methionine gamma-lyase [Bacillus wudalianchiensis]|uniref:L-methionine gamma-lyase n=2 Tax=Pseudobacillus wudalianchiensis TaxID=1743143 RepID=A0A1B9AT73_9BACI|nr:methionine gamma-lyase [Bacillus wudalianchiensis]OCA87125.1 methionine gamma-lyase [Bacillus wudalianchiensis]